jgi:hypothetical protein
MKSLAVRVKRPQDRAARRVGGRGVFDVLEISAAFSVF